MSTYYKAIRPDGTSFWNGTFRWAPRGEVKAPYYVKHPTSGQGDSDA